MSEHLQSHQYEQLLVDEAISLKAVSQNEAAQLFAITDQNREHLSSFLPWVNNVNKVEDSLDFIRTMQNRRAQGVEYGFGVRYNNELVGHVSLMHINDGNVPEIGYWITKNFAGKGITTKVTAALTEFGFNELGIEKIILRINPNNIVSSKVAQANGYTISGQDVGDLGETLNVWSKLK